MDARHSREIGSAKLELACMGSLLKSTEICLYFKDLKSRYLLVSAGWIAVVAPERTVEEIVGKSDFDFFSEEHATAAFEDEQQIIRTGVPMVGKLDGRPSMTDPATWSRPRRCRPGTNAARPSAPSASSAT